MNVCGCDAAGRTVTYSPIKPQPRSRAHSDPQHGNITISEPSSSRCSSHHNPHHRDAEEERKTLSRKNETFLNRCIRRIICKIRNVLERVERDLDMKAGKIQFSQRAFPTEQLDHIIL